MQVLQWLGGGFYLLNKIFLSFSEHALLRENQNWRKKWRISSWVVYLLGLPPWVIIFIKERNWIAASVEAGGAPAMILGLVMALRGKESKAPPLLKRTAQVSIAFGFAYSLYDFGGLNTVNQWLEVGLVVGYLVGTYLLALEKMSGYLWYVLMHVACGWLMWIQGYPWLFLQQVVSLVFIFDAYRVAKRIEEKVVLTRRLS